MDVRAFNIGQKKKLLSAKSDILCVRGPVSKLHILGSSLMASARGSRVSVKRAGLSPGLERWGNSQK